VTRRRQALLCAEAGAGLGHIQNLVRLGSLLMRRGWRVAVAGPGAAAFPSEAPDGMDMREAPRWGHALAAPLPRTGSSATHGDILADLGLRSAAAVRDQIVWWHLRFSEICPDLVVADYAPGVLLAARGRIPALVVGNGYTAPPAEMPRFPLLHGKSRIRDDEEAVCATVNEVLAEGGVRPLSALPEVFAGDAQCVFTYPQLDPYRAERGQPVLGLLPEYLGEGGQGGEEVFVYFQSGGQDARALRLVAALRRLDMPVRAYLPGAPVAYLDWLSASGAVVEPGPVPPSRIRARSRLLVHHGSHGFSALGLAAGIPQVACHWDIEKELNAQAVAAASAGLAVPVDYVSDEELEAEIRRVVEEPGFAEAARRSAAELSCFDPARAAQTFLETAKDLAG